MTATVTEREFPPQHNGQAPRLDSPAVSTPARARIPVTDGDGKTNMLAGVRGRARASLATWWVLTNRPQSIAELWRASAVDPKRIPGNSPGLSAAWTVSNWTDRLLILLVILAAPTGLTGPLRWIATRPTRRWGFYVVAAVAALVCFVTGKG